DPGAPARRAPHDRHHAGGGRRPPAAHRAGARPPDRRAASRAAVAGAAVRPCSNTCGPWGAPVSPLSRGRRASNQGLVLVWTIAKKGLSSCRSTVLSVEPAPGPEAAIMHRRARERHEVSLVGKTAPELTATAYVNGEDKQISCKDYKGTSHVLCWCPVDFTFI